MSLHIAPVTLEQAKRFVRRHHRHNKPPTGWKFGVGLCRDGGPLLGVATAGRPVSREIQEREPLTVEVNRTCTDGTRNANSMLYGAIWRAAKALGYTRAITYTQAGETGASLKAAGWVKVKDLPARGSWKEHSKALAHTRDAAGNGGVARQLWEIRAASGLTVLPDFDAGDDLLSATNDATADLFADLEAA